MTIDLPKKTLGEKYLIGGGGDTTNLVTKTELSTTLAKYREYDLFVSREPRPFNADGSRDVIKIPSVASLTNATNQTVEGVRIPFDTLWNDKNDIFWKNADGFKGTNGIDYKTAINLANATGEGFDYHNAAAYSFVGDINVDPLAIGNIRLSIMFTLSAPALNRTFAFRPVYGMTLVSPATEISLPISRPRFFFDYNELIRPVLAAGVPKALLKSTLALHVTQDSGQDRFLNSAVFGFRKEQDLAVAELAI